MTTRFSPHGFRRKTLKIALALLAGLLLPAAGLALAYLITDIPGPAGSGSFGATVTVLSNGNFVVADPGYDAGAAVDVGAVYLYDGASRQLISTLLGSQAGDQVGNSGVTALSNGNYVVVSYNWRNGGVVQAGAATWCSGTVGCTGVVTTTNSLVGSQASDQVGNGGVTALSNGNYVVKSYNWRNGGVAQAGATTWCSGTAGCTGVVTTTNSLVGSQANDQVGYGGDIYGGGVTALSNGNYVVRSWYWDNGAVSDAGAVTWCSGTAGCTGVVSAANSLVGNQANDRVGYGYAHAALSNGNYVVSSAFWDNGAASDAGAVTWCSGAAGCTGVVTITNSLVGSQAGDQVGYDGVAALSNGNYVVQSTFWHNGAASDAGAVTWCNGTVGCTGPVTTTNSLVGSQAGDAVGVTVSALSNGNYVVGSLSWDNDARSEAGAATWCSGTVGCTGVVTTTNSLVGSHAYDWVGFNVKALSNGNYVVFSPLWDKGTTIDAGAVTWCGETAGCKGVVSTANSLVGSQSGDKVGSRFAALSNGNYVVGSPYWSNGAEADAGAATWCSGTAGCKGVVSAVNNLVGSQHDSLVGAAVRALSNGNYVVSSPSWENGAASDAGAVTWCSGMGGCTGVVSTTNSLVGSRANDQVGYGGATALSDGNYVVYSPYWDNGATSDSGAVTLGNGATGVVGPITSTNSVLGTAANGGTSMVFDYGSFNLQLVVGRPADNIVSIVEFFRVNSRVYLPLVRK